MVSDDVPTARTVGHGATLERLERELERVGDAVDETPEADFPAVSSLHFFRLQLLLDPVDGSPQLLLNSVFDGRLDQHLDDLLNHIGGWLGRLLQEYCGLETAGSTRPDRTAIAAFLHRHRQVENAVYLGVVGGTVADVRQEHHLRQVLGDYIDARVEAGEWGPDSAMSAENIRLELRRHILESRDPELPRAARPQLAWRDRVLRALSAVRAFVFTSWGPLHGEVRRRLMPTEVPQSWWRRLLFRGVLAFHYLWTRPFTWFGLLMVRDLERQEEDLSVATAQDSGQNAVDAPGSAKLVGASADPVAVPSLADLALSKVSAQQQREDHQVQNPLTVFLRVKDTTPFIATFRNWALRLILTAADGATSHLWNQGRLAGIGTIHSARLLQYKAGNGSQRFLFLSDYDGSWHRYLGDFLGVGRLAVVPIFTHNQGCPPTRWLLQVTPGFAPRFMTFIRRSMRPVHLWYSAWPEISMSNRLSNHRLRDGLFADSMKDTEATAWLRELDR